MITLELEIFESEPTLGGRANIMKGLLFDTGPSPSKLSMGLRRYFSNFGKKFYDYVDLIKVDPAVNYTCGETKTNLQLSSDISKLSDEISKFCPNDRNGLIEFLKFSKKI